MMTYEGYDDGSKELRSRDKSYSDHVYEYNDYLKKDYGPRFSYFGDSEPPRNKAWSRSESVPNVDLPPLDSLEEFEEIHAKPTRGRKGEDYEVEPSGIDDPPGGVPQGWTERSYMPKFGDARKSANEAVAKESDERGLAVDIFFDSINPSEEPKRRQPSLEGESSLDRIQRIKREIEEAWREYDEAKKEYDNALREYHEFSRKMGEERRARSEAQRQSRNEASNRILRIALGPIGLLLPTIEFY